MERKKLIHAWIIHVIITAPYATVDREEDNNLGAGGGSWAAGETSSEQAKHTGMASAALC